MPGRTRDARLDSINNDDGVGGRKEATSCRMPRPSNDVDDHSPDRQLMRACPFAT